MKKTLACILVIVMLAALFAGCGETANSSAPTSAPAAQNTQGASDGGNSVTGQDYVSGNIREETSTSEESEDSGIVEVVNAAFHNALTSLSPFQGMRGGGGSLLPIFYETLYSMQQGGEPQPLLAESRTMIDDQTYEYKLRDNIYDSNHNQITASDVVFSYKTAVEIGRLPALNLVDSVEAVDELTFRTHWKNALFIGDRLAFETVFFIIDEDSYTASPDDMVTTPVGTGPYVLEEFTSGYILTATLRDDYWMPREETPVLARGNAKTLNYYFITESAQRAVAVENGTVDFALVPATDAERIAGLENYRIVEQPNGTTSMLFCNCSADSICNDINLRKAIYYAISNENISAGLTTSPSRPVYDMSNPNFVDYYGDDYKADADAGNYYSYDPVKAKEYLDQSSYNGATLRLMYGVDEEMENTCIMIQAYLQAIGVETQLVAYQNDIISTYSEDSTAWDLYLCAWGSNDYAVNAWDKCLTESKYPWGGTINFVVDDELQRLLNEARSEETWSEETIKACRQYIIDNAYGMGILQTIEYYAVTDDCTQVVATIQGLPFYPACIYRKD